MHGERLRAHVHVCASCLHMKGVNSSNLRLLRSHVWIARAACNVICPLRDIPNAPAHSAGPGVRQSQVMIHIHARGVSACRDVAGFLR